MTNVKRLFISLEDLSDLFSEHDRWDDPLNLADDLRALGVMMYFRGKEADISEHYGRRPKVNADGAIVIVCYKTPPSPSLDEVMVRIAELPDEIKGVILEGATPSVENEKVSAREAGSRSSKNVDRSDALKEYLVPLLAKQLTNSTPKEVMRFLQGKAGEAGIPIVEKTINGIIWKNATGDVKELDLKALQDRLRRYRKTLSNNAFTQ